MVAVSVVTALTLVFPLGDGWTVSDGIALGALLVHGVVAAVIALVALLAIQRAHQDRNWRRVAWASSSAVVAFFVLT
jgi:pantoate kinase